MISERNDYGNMLQSSSLSSRSSSYSAGKCTLDELDAMTRRRLVAAYLNEEPLFVQTGRLNREVMRKLSDQMHISSNSIWKLLTFYRDSKLRNSEREADLMSSRIRTGWKRLDLKKLTEVSISPLTGAGGASSLQLLADAFRLKYPDRMISRNMLMRCLREVNIPQAQCGEALDLVAPYFCSDDMDTTSDSDVSVTAPFQSLQDFIERDDPSEKMMKELQEALCFFLCVFDTSSSSDDGSQESSHAMKIVKKEKKVKTPKSSSKLSSDSSDSAMNINRKRTLRDLNFESRQEIIDAYEKEDEPIPSKRLCKEKIASVGERLGITFDTVRKMVLFYRRSKEVNPDQDPDLMSNLVTTGCKKHDERKLQRVKKLRSKFDDVSVRDLTNKYNALYCDCTMSRGTMHEYLTVLGLI